MTWQAWFFVAVDCMLAFVLGQTIRGARRRVRELVRRNGTQARAIPPGGRAIFGLTPQEPEE